MGISDATFYVWKKRYGGGGPSELRRLRQLEEENRKLKQIVADLSLDKAMLQAVVAKKALRPSQRKELVPELMQGDPHRIRPPLQALACNGDFKGAGNLYFRAVLNRVQGQGHPAARGERTSKKR